jgi:fatty acid desaturase
VSSESTTTGVGIALLCGCGVLSALLELTLIPLYAGTVVVPVAALLAIAGNIALVLLARQLVAEGAVPILPFGAWVLTVLVVAGVPRPEGDVLAPGGKLEWVTYLVLGGGLLSGIGTAIATAGRPKPR